MRAWIIERASGAALVEIEAENSYGLFQALLDWGEAQGLARFQVPALYRTERNPTFGSVSEAPAQATASPARPRPGTNGPSSGGGGRQRRKALAASPPAKPEPQADDGRLNEAGADADAAPAVAPERPTTGVAEATPLTFRQAFLVTVEPVIPADPPARRVRRPAPRRPAAPAGEQLRLWEGL